MMDEKEKNNEQERYYIETIYNNIEFFRKRREDSVTELEDYLGIPRSTLARNRKNLYNLKQDTLNKIALRYGIGWFMLTQEMPAFENPEDKKSFEVVKILKKATLENEIKWMRDTPTLLDRINRLDPTKPMPTKFKHRGETFCAGNSYYTMYREAKFTISFVRILIPNFKGMFYWGYELLANKDAVDLPICTSDCVGLELYLGLDELYRAVVESTYRCHTKETEIFLDEFLKGESFN